MPPLLLARRPCRQLPLQVNEQRSLADPVFADLILACVSFWLIAHADAGICSTAKLTSSVHGLNCTFSASAVDEIIVICTCASIFQIAKTFFALCVRTATVAFHINAINRVVVLTTATRRHDHLHQRFSTHTNSFTVDSSDAPTPFQVNEQRSLTYTALFLAHISSGMLFSC